MSAARPRSERGRSQRGCRGQRRGRGRCLGCGRRGHRARCRRHGLVALAGAGQLERRLVLVGLATVVGRDLVGVVLLPARVSFRELLVELARVEQDERRQLDRAGRRVDPSAVAGLDEQRQEPAVIEMGVGQQDRVELVRLVGERDPVPDRFVRAALEHPAVDQDPGPIGDEQELRAGDRGRAAEELDVHGRHGDSATVGPRILRADGHRGGRTVVRRTARRPRRHRRRTDPGRAGRSRGWVDDRARAPLPAAAAALRRSSSRRSMTARSIGEDARALANMRGSLDWIDPMEPTPGLPTTGSAGPLPAHPPARHRPSPAPGRRSSGDMVKRRARSGSVPRRSIG